MANLQTKLKIEPRSFGLQSAAPRILVNVVERQERFAQVRTFTGGLAALTTFKLRIDPAHSKPDVGVKCLCNVHISAPPMRRLMRCIIHLTLLKSYFTPRRPLDYISFKRLMKLQALHWTAPVRPV